MKSLLRSSVFKIWQDHETKCLKTVAEGKRAIYITFNVLSINKMKFVFVNMDYFRACIYIYAKKLIRLHSVFFILLLCCLCPEKRTWKGLFSGNHVCPRLSRPVLTSNVFPIFPINHKNVPYMSTFLCPNASPNLLLTHEQSQNILLLCCL